MKKFLKKLFSRSASGAAEQVSQDGQDGQLEQPQPRGLRKMGIGIMGAIVALVASATGASASGGGSSVVPDFTGVDVGFTPGDLLSGATGFYTLFIGFIVLILSIKFAPQIIGFLMGLFGKGKKA